MRLLSTAGLVLLLSVASVRADDDPVREGKKLSEWLKILKDSGPRPSLRNGVYEAQGVISSLGAGDEEAAPLLVRELEQLDSFNRTLVADALHKIGPAAVPRIVP